MTTRVDLTFQAWNPDSEPVFDIFIGCCGYEPRAVHAAQKYQDRIQQMVAIDYSSGHVHNYDSNRAYYELHGKIWSPPPGKSEKAFLSERLTELVFSSSDAATQIAIDISSCDRQRLADLILVCTELAQRHIIEVTFLYSVGDFSTTSLELNDPVMTNTAVSGFEGWSSDPALPVVCIVGLGYERRMALAAVETLEPAETAAFIATNLDKRFEGLVEEINSEILSSEVVPRLRYDILAPLPALSALDAFVKSRMGRSRVALVPLGPKLFALMSYLVALLEGPDVAVWRVSPLESGGEQARTAAGPVVGLQVRITAS